MPHFQSQPEVNPNFLSILYEKVNFKSVVMLIQSQTANKSHHFPIIVAHKKKIELI